jgi:1-phosphatidylinositol-3-phosphate 5-kinase
VTGVENVTSTTSTFATSIASQLFRFVMNSPEVPSSPVLQTPKHHGLLHRTDVENIDDRPHIKYDWTVGKRLKFSCTVFYAKQFDSLRRRCGIEDVFVKSLSKSANWAAEGGKSKSNFWKTSDDRFIIKTLVNAWNVADLYVQLSYLPFIVSPADNPIYALQAIFD